MVTDELIQRRPKGRSGLADWYGELFEAQRAEGLSTSEVASLLDVGTSNLHYWQRQLRKRAMVDDPAADSTVEDALPGLVRVRLAEKEGPGHARTGSSLLEVRLAGTRSVLVPSGFHRGDLRALVEALESC